MKRILLFISIVGSLQCFGQKASSHASYFSAYEEIKGMLKDSIKIDFKKAVFICENAYINGGINYALFDEHIKYLAYKASQIASQQDLIYEESDKETVKKLAAVFRLMTDTIRFYKNETDTSSYYESVPYGYDFDDFWGEKDWRQMFVTKLLLTHKGNCHSLPLLYKIICEELGVKSYLAMAPNHIYIKTWCKKNGWYNTELTSGHFPIDAWIMASGYVHLSSVQNRVYMDTLSNKQSLAVCLIDLAKGYEKKFGDYADLKFILKSCNLALEHYPQYVNGLILKAETLKKQFERNMRTAGAKYPSDIFHVPEYKTLFEEMQSLYLHIHEIGYRKMPREMYASWLAELNKEKEKYQNKNLHKDLNKR